MRIFLSLIILFLSSSVIAENTPGAEGENPFILIARIHIKEGKTEAYLNIANEVDEAVEASEPGMLLHTFDADPSDPLGLKFMLIVKPFSIIMLTHQLESM